MTRHINMCASTAEFCLFYSCVYNSIESSHKNVRNNSGIEFLNFLIYFYSTEKPHTLGWAPPRVVLAFIGRPIGQPFSGNECWSNVGPPFFMSNSATMARWSSVRLLYSIGEQFVRRVSNARVWWVFPKEIASKKWSLQNNCKFIFLASLCGGSVKSTFKSPNAIIGLPVAFISGRVADRLAIVCIWCAVGELYKAMMYVLWPFSVQSKDIQSHSENGTDVLNIFWCSTSFRT